MKKPGFNRCCVLLFGRSDSEGFPALGTRPLCDIPSCRDCVSHMPRGYRVMSRSSFSVCPIRLITLLQSRCIATFHAFYVTTACLARSLFLLYEGVRDLFAAVYGRDDN
jgi:hypothetical protein